MGNEAAMPMTKQFNRYMATADGPDESYPLAVSCENKIAVTDQLSVYSSDEMSWDFLKKVSSFQRAIDWDNTQVSGTSLLSMSVRPETISQIGTTIRGGHTLTYAVGPPVFQYGRFFQQYRGSFNVWFKLAKTDYHTGRLQVTWTPTQSSTYVSPTVSTSTYSLREIIDIHTGDEFCFNLPYMLDSNYIPTALRTGVLDVVILNELKAPETVASSVQILMFFNGGDDFEFQVPGVSLQGDSRLQLPINPQTGGDEELICEPIGGEVYATPTCHYSQMSQGECGMTSIKRFLNRYSPLQSTTLPSTADSSVVIWPWLNSIYALDAGGIQSGSPHGGDIYCRVSQSYAFFRGGARIAARTSYQDATATTSGRNNTTTMTTVVTDNVSSAQPVWAGGDPSISNGTVQNYLLSSSRGGLNGYVVTDSGVGHSAATVPYYAPYRMSFNLRQGTAGTINTDPTQPRVRLHVSSEGGFRTGNYSFLRSFPDDFQLCYFIGCPPMFVSHV